MKKRVRVLSALLATTLVAGATVGTTEIFARSSLRAAWNDASGSSTESTAVNDACYVEDTSTTGEHSVYSNVYADSAEWTAWKKLWSESIGTSYEQVALTPGKHATELNLAWYSKTEETPKVKLMDSKGNLIKEFTGTQDISKIEEFVEGDATVTLYPNKVTVTGLKENTSYKYQYYLDGSYSEVFDYSTRSTEEFSVMYVGDPQIGASTGQTTADGTTSSENGKEYYAMNDAYNWIHTLEQASEANPNLSFILSAGDQINQSSVSTDANKLQQQKEYAGFLYPSILRSLPLATTIGNHDSGSQNYSNHFNNPNAATSAENTEGQTAAGTDYYFRYGNTLFISIDTNNYNCATHENVIKEAVNANTDAKWRVLMFHQDIYGSGYDHSDSDGMILRTQLTPIIDNYGIDVVLQGHDHTYSRTYQISADGVKEAFGKNSATNTQAYYDANANCYDILTNKTTGTKVIDPEGTVYFEANSSTGSKYYQMIGTQQDYIAARSQSWRPTYSVLDITDTTFTVKTYDAATNEELVADGNIQTSYTIVKSADKTALKTELTKAQTTLANAKKAGTYTDASVKILTDTIAAAQKICNNAESTTTDIASAITSLQEAEKGLTEKPKTATVTKPAATTISTVSNTAKGVKLTWKKTSNAQGYYVYRKTGSGSWKQISKTTSLSLTDKAAKNGTTYQYKVYAYNGNIKSSASAAKKITYLKTPSITSVKNTAAKTMTVKIKKNAKAAGYEIIYSTSSSFKNATTVKAASVTKAIKKLTKGKKYYVKVRAYKGNSYSTWSAKKSVKIAK